LLAMKLERSCGAWKAMDLIWTVFILLGKILWDAAGENEKIIL
jgi:hypothetical protein